MYLSSFLSNISNIRLTSTKKLKTFTFNTLHFGFINLIWPKTFLNFPLLATNQIYIFTVFHFSGCLNTYTSQLLQTIMMHRLRRKNVPVFLNVRLDYIFIFCVFAGNTNRRDAGELKMQAN